VCGLRNLEPIYCCSCHRDSAMHRLLLLVAYEVLQSMHHNERAKWRPAVSSNLHISPSA